MVQIQQGVRNQVPLVHIDILASPSSRRFVSYSGPLL